MRVGARAKVRARVGLRAGVMAVVGARAGADQRMTTHDYYVG